VHPAPIPRPGLWTLLLGPMTPWVNGTEAGERLRRSELTDGEPSGGMGGISMLEAPSRTDWCFGLARWLTGASMPASMAHGGAAARRPHRSKARQGGRSGAGAPRLQGEAGAREKVDEGGVEQGDWHGRELR
jgi:hypothetical protein